MKTTLLALLMTITDIVKGKKLAHAILTNCICLIESIYDYSEFSPGEVELSPSEVAPVCQVGDQLELTCSVTGIFLRWEFSVPGTQMPFGTAVVSAGGPSGVPPPVVINSTSFTFSRHSTQPLTSTLMISPVSEGLNGVQVNCVDVVASKSVTTAIQIVDATSLRGRQN